MIWILAHGVGGRTDLPLPLWLFMYGAAFALLISFVALRILWPKPRLAQLAAGRRFSLRGSPATWLLAAVRVSGFFAFAVVLFAAVAGNADSASNLAPYALYIGFWVGVQVVGALVVDVFALANPFDTLAFLCGIPERTSRVERRDPGQWTAAFLLASFVWLELAYHTPSSPRAIGVWLSLYTAAVLTGAAVWGRGWLRHGEGFAALFGFLGRLAPIGVDAETKELRLRAPLAGLAEMTVRPGTAATVFVALGSTTFDGFSRTQTWRDVLGQRTGWSATFVTTIGLVGAIALVAVAYLAATRVAARITDEDAETVATAFLPSLVPIAFAYAVAHYFSLLVLDGQNLLALVSDPFGRGWDLFGTIDRTVDYRLVSVTTIANVQAAAIVIGHVCGVVFAHDRAVERYKPRLAVRSQYPLLVVMIAYTVGGLAILLGG